MRLASTFTLWVLCSLSAAVSAVEEEPKPLLFANYYAWYHNGSHPDHPWAGWTRKESEQNSRALAEQRPGLPPRSSAAYPLVGLYDSADPEVAEWHVRLAQAAGIDAFLVDWWGRHLDRDKNIDEGILVAAEKHSFKFALLDERSQFHSDWEWYKQAAVETLTRYKDSPAYLRIDGRPVYYLYQVASTATLTPEKFVDLKRHVESRVGPVYWIVDKIAHQHAAQRAGDADKEKHIPADWLATPGIDAFGFYSTFSHFRAHRYEDLAGKYKYLTDQAHDAGKKMLLPVHPGHNNSRFREDPYVMPRLDGQTLRNYLRAASDAGADFLMVTSWNEWPETTVVEPSSNWPDPYHYLRILAEWKEKAFHVPPAPLEQRGESDSQRLANQTWRSVSPDPDALPSHLQTVVADTHEASLQVREHALRKTIAKDSCWPQGAWGDTMWALAALSLNEKVDDANERLLKRATDYVNLKRQNVATSAFTPEQAKETPWAYFALTDYVRILCLFHAKSVHYPGRLHPETEATMKEALWFWAKADSKVADASLENLFVLRGTENHDLTRRPNDYLVASILKDDPLFGDRLFDDGHNAAEHAAAYEAFFREWPRQRAIAGLWFEVGSDTYQKYSWPALMNLHELAPDPVVRKRFGMLLDLAFIEEAQISVQGRRGGGRSRASYGENNFESYKNLLYAPDGAHAESSHSKALESCRYQLPAAAILLRKVELPARSSFQITNRVLGELAPGGADEGEGTRYCADSALVNYAHRTPHYLMGSTLQNPALSMPNPKAGKPTLKYGGISRQKRWCGILFEDPANDEVSAVYPVIEKTRGGRPQHSHWSVQHENVLLIQRIAPETAHRIGSYSTGKIKIRFQGQNLEKREQDGWIFANNGKAFVGVKFLDGDYGWDEANVEAAPINFNGSTDKSRILFHAGDITTHGSFEEFRADLLANRLVVTKDKVEYCFRASEKYVESSLFDGDHLERFRLPRIDGEPINLRPPMTYQSPYLNGAFGSDRIVVTVGPVKQILDFSM
ncbi:hypothetical protein Poly41_24870 [Novipirellula artificiosorum]|uniref:Uncharacterized protein n=2 Tax=Novipirellula artificiosorum TaxID=2528016 RepID=A0A5C6DSM0_9BACT|nr:hypothetical protein Poly41_24870 [Novipirellula artificiosorum]